MSKALKLEGKQFGELPSVVLRGTTGSGERFGTATAPAGSVDL